MGLFYFYYYAGNAVIPAPRGRAADLWAEAAPPMAAAISALAVPMLHRRLAAHEVMLARA